MSAVSGCVAPGNGAQWTLSGLASLSPSPSWEHPGGVGRPQEVCALDPRPGRMRKVTPCEVQASWRPRTMLISRGNRSLEKQEPQEQSSQGPRKGSTTSRRCAGHCRDRRSRRQSCWGPLGSLAGLQPLPEKPEPEAAAGWSYTPLSSVLGTHFFPGACAHAHDQEPTFEKESRAFQLSEGTPAWDVGFAVTHPGRWGRP